MLFGILLVVTWLILLIRYPHKALPVSLVALLGIGLLAGWVLWQEARDEERLTRLELSLDYAPDQCPAHRPLRVTLRNTSSLPLRELTWRIAAYPLEDDLNLTRADLYQRLECPPGERFDLQHALLLSEDPRERLRLTERLREARSPAVVH